jgi:uncharacterized protein (TIGR02145 family)
VVIIGFLISFSSCIAQPMRASIIKMPDGKMWTTRNLNFKIANSYCYDDDEGNCKIYGRLYTWEAAREGCKLIGRGWRLPSELEWKKMAKHYGGIVGDSDDDGKAAYEMLINNGESLFNILLSGGRDLDGAYRRIEEHGFYWTSTSTSDSTAWLYNFGNNMKIINHHNDMEKRRAVAVRCIKD